MQNETSKIMDHKCGNLLIPDKNACGRRKDSRRRGNSISSPHYQFWLSPHLHWLSLLQQLLLFSLVASHSIPSSPLLPSAHHCPGNIFWIATRIHNVVALQQGFSQLLMIILGGFPGTERCQ